MVAAVGITTPAGRALATVRQAAGEEIVTSGRSLIAINFPSEAMEATEGRAEAAVRQNALVEVTQARAMVVARGRIANPRLRAWTFSLDGHDYFVLRLGDRFGTLVYDTSTGQWCDWESLDLPFWRANVGVNWLGANRQGPVYGSNVLVGDDTWGLLWLLDPDLGYDEHPDYLTNTKLYFDRIVMGQYVKRGYDAEPCYEIDLSASLGQPALSGQTVLLEISDDGGKTFRAQDAIPVETDSERPLSWMSLGQITPPGRLFRITDNGALPRIDDMEMNPDAG